MDKLLDRLIEVACAVAVVALTVTVSLQVFNRFVLKTPLAWSEDLAMLLFQWVVFLGAALGVKRLRHFGIELVVRKFPERMRHWVELLTPVVMAIVALVMIVQGWILLTFNRARTFPTMDLTYTWAFLPIPLAGAAHPHLPGPARDPPLAREHAGRRGARAMSMTPIVILLGGFIFLLALNVPVAFSMVLACIAALWWQGTIPISTVTMKLYSGIDTFPFLAIPLFILAGALMEQGGISARLVRLATNLVGHIRGGLGFVVVVSEIFFSGISGSSIADASAIGSLLLPSMVRAGYTAARATAIVAAATGMGMMIPPCLNMVVLGAVANISIAGLFMGGFLPGFLMALTLMVIIYVQSSPRDPARRDRGQTDDAGGADLRAG